MPTSSGLTNIKKQEKVDSDSSPLLITEHENDYPGNKGDGNEQPPSPLDAKENIKQKYLVEMPDDFYQFWEFCQSICQQNISGKLDISSVWLELMISLRIIQGFTWIEIGWPI